MNDPITATDLIAIASDSEAALVNRLVRRVLDHRGWAEFREEGQVRTIAPNSPVTAPHDLKSGIGDTGGPTEPHNGAQALIIRFRYVAIVDLWFAKVDGWLTDLEWSGSSKHALRVQVYRAIREHFGIDGAKNVLVEDPEDGIYPYELHEPPPIEAQKEPQRPCVHCAAPLHRAPCGYWATPDGSERCWNAFDFLHEPRPSRVTETSEATPQAPAPEASTDESNPSEGNPERSEGAAGTKSFSEISSEAAEWQRSQDLPDLTDEEAEQLAVAKARAIRSMLNAPWKPPT